MYACTQNHGSATGSRAGVTSRSNMGEHPPKLFRLRKSQLCFRFFICLTTGNLAGVPSPKSHHLATFAKEARQSHRRRGAWAVNIVVMATMLTTTRGQSAGYTAHTAVAAQRGDLIRRAWLRGGETVANERVCSPPDRKARLERWRWRQPSGASM